MQDMISVCKVHVQYISIYVYDLVGINAFYYTVHVILHSIVLFFVENHCEGRTPLITRIQGVCCMLVCH
jgi:hypothetical protein